MPAAPSTRRCPVPDTDGARACGRRPPASPGVPRHEFPRQAEPRSTKRRPPERRLSGAAPVPNSAVGINLDDRGRERFAIAGRNGVSQAPVATMTASRSATGRHWSRRGTRRRSVRLSSLRRRRPRRRPSSARKSEIGGECACRHERVWVAPSYGSPGRALMRICRQQMQRLPSLGMPALADPPTLQHDMIDAAHAEASAHGEASLAAADDDDISLVHGRVSFEWG